VGSGGQAILDLKGPSYVAAPRILGQANEEIVAWGGEASAPILACADEKPIHRWLDILYLTGRLAPAPSFLPDGARERALMLGFPMKFADPKGSDGTAACRDLLQLMLRASRSKS